MLKSFDRILIKKAILDRLIFQILHIDNRLLDYYYFITIFSIPFSFQLPISWFSCFLWLVFIQILLT